MLVASDSLPAIADSGIAGLGLSRRIPWIYRMAYNRCSGRSYKGAVSTGVFEWDGDSVVISAPAPDEAHSGWSNRRET